MTRNSILLLLALLGVLFAKAQPFSPERTGGVYYAYAVADAQRIDMPDGYTPFYISHYGRHGSRWLPTESRYHWVMSHFGDDRNLTPLGRDVKRRLKKICKNVEGNGGQLTPLGKRQHRDIARRMAANYPEVFSDQPSAAEGSLRVRARSTVVPRCRASMLAFLDALPCKGVAGETSPAFMYYMNHESDELKAYSSRVRGRANISPDRFVNALFRQSPFNGNRNTALRLLSEMHTIASDMQDVPLSISLWDIFTREEMLAVHAANDERMTLCNGDTPLNFGIAARSSVALWQNIVEEADSMIASGGHGASLRFGHDTALFRLLTLLRMDLPGESMEDIVPMAANLQMVFLRKASGEQQVEGSEKDSDSVLVSFLHNEQPRPLALLPPLSSSPSSFFYLWADVKRAVAARIHELEHQRQLSALSTMVGTDQANTRTAGLFGKGSEEKGQTLPAVLVPHGQTFWTAQTQPTEQKCIAPYYYRDTLFYGFRASHWLVGGCTQDYGSFTVSVKDGAGSATAEGTPFNHQQELSHPHYYAVSLPQEHVRLELTALSHCAMLRVMPRRDGLLTIVVRANSDEHEGGVSLDARRRQVYGFNPVHRIYQGWGERAGFSGHFLLEYADSLVGSESLDQAVSLTFMGRRDQPVVLKMATSFTSREGAERNLRAEGNTTFEQMMEQCANRWMERFHAIDVCDPDTARVNQFYGALYRASFLPREMSDADGCYPLFAGRTNSQANPSGSIRYGDFSMWDTYRAQHPLLCIIAPEQTAQMMQSLVGMADEGGWLPIFPCWNSYTAAMIGDHCSSVLADAYVKDIRGFDAPKAYRYMRRNAFEQPATYKEYENGMGRRALASYLKWGYIPLEDSVKEAFHQQEQTSRTLEYAYDDFCVAQMAQALDSDGGVQPVPSYSADYDELMRRSENWRNVINPLTGYADGRHAPLPAKKKGRTASKQGAWLGNQDVVSRQPYITEGATCHYTWYVPQNIPGLIALMGGEEPFVEKLDSMFTQGRYWHGNEPCHQVAWLYSLAGHPEKTVQRVGHILQTEYNDSPGGLSGNDDAGQMSAWQVFASLGFYPVCPATPQYVLGGSRFQQVTLNQPGRKPFVIRCSPDGQYRLNGQPLQNGYTISHADLLRGGELLLPAM